MPRGHTYFECQPINYVGDSSKFLILETRSSINVNADTGERAREGFSSDTEAIRESCYLIEFYRILLPRLVKATDSCILVGSPLALCGGSATVARFRSNLGATSGLVGRFLEESFTSALEDDNCMII